jgi:hypothetical protein
MDTAKASIESPTARVKRVIKSILFNASYVFLSFYIEPSVA